MNMNFFYKLDIVQDTLDMFKEKEMYYVHLHHTPWWSHLGQWLVKFLSLTRFQQSAAAHASLPGHCSNENSFTTTNYFIHFCNKYRMGTYYVPGTALFILGKWWVGELDLAPGPAFILEDEDQRQAAGAREP